MDELVDKLIDDGVLVTDVIIEAFRNVDRADFVPEDFIEEAYLDRPLPISGGQTISQPYTVAFMLERLSPESGQKILDVGAGSGWTTALLAYIAGEKGQVYGVEIDSDLVDYGNENIAKYDFDNVTIELAGSTLGYPDKAPYSRILVSAAGDELPGELVDQLGENGTMLIPVQLDLLAVTKHAGDVDVERYPGFAFVPLVES